jgi:hypothetical protein
MASRCKTVFEASGTLRARVSLRESIRQPGTFMSKRCMRTPIYTMVMEEVRCGADFPGDSTPVLKIGGKCL